MNPSPSAEYQDRPTGTDEKQGKGDTRTTTTRRPASGGLFGCLEGLLTLTASRRAFRH